MVRIYLIPAPVYQFSERQGNQMTIHFSQVGRGLMAKGKELKGFTIAGEDKQFVPAKAEIKGNTVVVSSSSCTVSGCREVWLGACTRCESL